MRDKVRERGGSAREREGVRGKMRERGGQRQKNKLKREREREREIFTNKRTDASNCPTTPNLHTLNWHECEVTSLTRFPPIPLTRFSTT